MDGDGCPVCLERSERRLDCGHCLCEPCQQKMVHATCPLCRAPIGTEFNVCPSFSTELTLRVLTMRAHALENAQLERVRLRRELERAQRDEREQRELELERARLARLAPAQGINAIVRRIGWRIDDASARPYWTREDGRPVLDADELATVLHPSGDWLLLAEFDDRALDANRLADHATCTLAWAKRMRADATVGDLLAVLRATYGYGYFEGIEPYDRHDRLGDLRFRADHAALPRFRLHTGT